MKDYLPVNQYNVLRHNLPDAELVFTKGFLHDLLVIHSEEELDCVRKAAEALPGRHGGDGRARATWREGIRAAGGGGRRHPRGGGDIDFLIIGSTPMDNPAMIFGNPRPPARAQEGRHINMELRRRLSRLLGADRLTICVGEPTEMVRKFWEEITLPAISASWRRSRPASRPRICASPSQFFRDKGVQSRPTKCTASILVTDNPHISAEHVKGEEIDMMLKPGMIIMAEPNPITPTAISGSSWTTPSS
jgi:hypothetical protein